MERNDSLQLQLTEGLNRLLELTPLGIVLIDSRGLILGFNKRAYKIFGIDNKHLVGYSINSIFPTNQKEQINKFISHCFYAKDKTYSKIFERKNNKGNKQFLEVICSKINNQENVNIMLVFQDVSPRIIAEREHEFDHKRVNQVLKELKKSRDQLEIIIRNVEDGIIVRDSKGKPIYANSVLVKMLNYKSVKELLSHSLNQVVSKFRLIDESGKEVSPDRLPVLRATKGELSPKETLIFQDKETGIKRWLTLKAKPIFDKNNKVQFIVNVVSDITERKKEENQRDMFIGLAGHELRNTLAGIKAFDQILQIHIKKNKYDSASLYLSKIDERVDKLTKLINDLLDITKIRAGKLDFFTEVFDLNELLKKIVGELKPSTKHKLILKTKIKKLVIVDKDRIEQVLTNLIINAIKYSPENKKIIINAFSDNNFVKITVQDFGIGIPKSKQHKIFEPYYRVESRYHEKQNGLGLGLFLAKEIIEHFGGEIWVESIEGKGSIFHINLPLKPQAS